MDARSITLLEFPAVRARLAEKTSFDPSRRLAEALVPVVRRGDRAPQPRRDRPGARPARGAGRCRHRRGARHRPGVDRAARGGRLDAQQFLEIAETLDAAARLATTLAEERRPLLRELGRAAPPAARRSAPPSRAASTRRASCSTPRRRGSAACGRPSGSPTTGCAAASTRSSARSWAARSRSRSSRCATAATSSRSAPTHGRGSRASSTTRRAAARRCSSSRSWSWSWATPGARPRSPRTEEVGRILDELSALVAANAAPLRETLEALAQFDFWAAKAQLAAEMDGVRAETAERPEVVLLSARHPGLTGPRRARSTSASATATRRSSSPARTPAARPSRCARWACSRLMHQAGLHVPAARGQPAADLPRRVRRHRRRAVDRPVAVDLLGPHALDHPDRRGAPGRARSCSSTSWAPARTRPRARRSPRPCSTTSSGPVALVAATTHYAELKAYAHTTPGATNAVGRVRPRDALPDVPPHDRPAGRSARRSRSRSGSACRRRSSPTLAPGSPRTSAPSRRRSPRSARRRRETAESTERAREAEVRAADALRAADEERRRARRERDEAVRGAPARRPSASSTSCATRSRRRPPPARARDASPRRPSTRPSSAGGGDAWPRLPAGGPHEREPTPAEPRDLAASASAPGAARAAGRAGSRPSRGRHARHAGGGRDARHRGRRGPGAGRRPAGAGGASRGPGAGREPARRPRRGLDGIASCGCERARTVASSLDLRGARVDEALDALDRYLEDASLAGLEQVIIIHGLGTGALRDAVRRRSRPIRWSSASGAGERGEGGDGATIVSWL